MKDPDLLPQDKRENPDPREIAKPIPHVVHTLMGVVLAFGMVHIGIWQVDIPFEWGDGRSRAEPIGTTHSTAACEIDGAATSAAACAACPQAMPAFKAQPSDGCASDRGRAPAPSVDFR